MKLVLPYPISGNEYWGQRIILRRDARRGQELTARDFYPSNFVTTEARRYIRDVKIALYEQGVREKIVGRVFVRIDLYPHRPQDWERRARLNPLNWDDDVRCLDLDNARKVLNDALKNTLFGDDKWIWEDAGKRMEPDAGGARLVVTVEPIIRVSPQPALFQAGADRHATQH